MAPTKKTKPTSGKRTVTPTKPAIVPGIYLRVSTEEQAKEGYGLKHQLKRCLAQVTVKDWPDVPEHHIYTDEGISGTLGPEGRPALAQLLADIEAGEINAVVVLGLDRLGRKTRIVLSVVDQITGAGAELLSCKESLDTSTPTGRFVLTMFAALAELDRDQLVEKLTGGRDARGEVDGEKGGRIPYGYARRRDATGKAIGIMVDREVAPIVKKIFRLEGRGVSQRQIAATLNQEGIPGPRGGKWHASSVGEILKNRPAYRGGVRGDSAASWPAIL